MTKEEIYFLAFIGFIVLCIAYMFWIKPAIHAFKIRRRGRKGERNIEKVLKNLSLPHSQILHNCYLPLSSSSTTEIDLLLICEQGIFVFESKNYKGYVRGRGDEENWTQEFNGEAYRPIVHTFYNPVWQNETHIKALQNLINRSDIPIFSLVVFSNECELNAPPVCKKARVLQLKDLKKTMKKICEDKDGVGEVLGSDEIYELYNLLRPYTKVSLDVKKQHLENIKRIQKKKTCSTNA